MPRITTQVERYEAANARDTMVVAIEARAQAGHPVASLLPESWRDAGWTLETSDGAESFPDGSCERGELYLRGEHAYRLEMEGPLCRVRLAS